MGTRQKQDLCEIFGFSPDDTSKQCDEYWNRELCPFVGTKCSKYNHDKSITYGVCSVISSGEEIIICPKRLYANNYQTLREVSQDAFGYIPLYLVHEAKNMELVKEVPSDFILAFGQNSGKEIQVGSLKNKLSMDWVLVRVLDGEPVELAGVEVQSIDITNNYRDAWESYKLIRNGHDIKIPSSKHGMNWANVHKRLIPQIIRKGQIYMDSKLATKGLYFIVPNAVYNRFESVVNNTAQLDVADSGCLSVFTYSLGDTVDVGSIRSIKRQRVLRVLLEEFALNFISGGQIPGSALDEVIKNQVRSILS